MNLTNKSSTTIDKAEAWDILLFTYNGEQKYVYVVHPRWENKLHGVDITFIPRKYFVRVANAPIAFLTEHQLYERYINVYWIKSLDAYRTYDRSKISGVFLLNYDRSIQPDEKDESEVTSVDETEGVI